jgi:hypothetical protein
MRNNLDVDGLPPVRIKAGVPSDRRFAPPFTLPYKGPKGERIETYVAKVFPGNITNIGSLNEDLTQYSFFPKKKDVGEYWIEILVKAKLFADISKVYKIKVTVFDDPPPPVYPTLGERVGFEIIDINKKG